MKPAQVLPVACTLISILGAAFVGFSARQHRDHSPTRSLAVRSQNKVGPNELVDRPSALTDQKPATTHDLTDAPPAAPVVVVPFEESVIGQSVEGRPITRLRIGDGAYVILIMASIHGNETAGTPLVKRLAEEVRKCPELVAGKTLIVLPLVNPDGDAVRIRYNARGVDLNRNFPAENRENSSRYGLQALSEPEAVAVFRTLEDFPPQHIVTLHEPLQCVDYDGPAKQLAEAISAAGPLPVKKLGSRPGSLGSFAGLTLKIPTVTLELPPNAATQSNELLWRFYGEALLESVRFRCDQ